MSLCLINILKEWIGIIFVVLRCAFAGDSLLETTVISYNVDNVNTLMTVKTIDYEVKKIYNNEIPTGTVNYLTEGEVGLIYNVDGEEVIFRQPINEILEIGTGPKSTYNGNITGYGADCPGCSGKVSCKTPEGEYYNLAAEGEYYSDSEYGSLRVVAADNSLFECGTVLDIISSNGTKINAIVLDTGSALRSEWRNKRNIVVDIAFKTENNSEIYQITDRTGNVKFNVKRWGW